MSESNYGERIKNLEDIELRDQDNTSQDVYKKLLIYYLLDEQPMKAKFLWKRIPKSMRAVGEGNELVHLWNLIQLLIQQKYSQLFELSNVHKKWSSEELTSLFTSLIEKTRERLFDLISAGYSSINIKEMAVMFGISDDECVRICLSKGWGMDETRHYLIPKKKRTYLPKTQTKDIMEIPNQIQMKQLTNLVSFLET